MSVYRSKDGRWRFRVVGHWSDGIAERVSGTAPKNENTKAAAMRAEVAQLADMASRPSPRNGATKEDAPSTVLAVASAPSHLHSIAAVARTEIPMLTNFSEVFLSVAKLENKDGSIENKESMLRVHILPRIGDLRLDQIDFAVVQDLALHLKETASACATQNPTKLHPNTINKILGCLLAVLRLAFKRRLIAVVPDFTKLRSPEATFDFLTFEEAEQLAQGAAQLSAEQGGDWTMWCHMVVVGLKTGMRRGELMGLPKGNVDLAGRRVRITRNYFRGRFGTPKGGAPREIPLNDQAVRTFAANAHVWSDDLVFCEKDGRPFTATRLRTALHKICDRAGLRRIGWHVLRHTFASHLVMRGVPLIVVQRLLGHTSIKVTQRYAHLVPEMLRDAVMALDSVARPAATPANDAATAQPLREEAIAQPSLTVVREVTEKAAA